MDILLLGYFNERLIKKDKNALIDRTLSSQAQYILYEVGLPNFRDFTSFKFDESISLIETEFEKYIQIGFCDDSPLCIIVGKEENVINYYNNQ